MEGGYRGDISRSCGIICIMVVGERWRFGIVVLGRTRYVCITLR
jgi:hypothetical protein